MDTSNSGFICKAFNINDKINNMSTDKEKNEQLHHWRSGLESSPYLGAHDLPGYKPIQLTIKHVKKHMSVKLKDNAVFNFAYFLEPGYKPMLLNATNSKMLRALTGSPFVEKWNMIKVEINVKEGIKAFGGVHDGLRITNKKLQLNKIKLTKDHPKLAEVKVRYAQGASIDVIHKYYDVDEKLLK